MAAKKTKRSAFVSGLEVLGRGQLKRIYPSLLLVSQNLPQMEGEISVPEADLSAFSSEVVTLTFPPAYVIPPTPIVLPPHPALIGLQEFCNFKSFFV